MTTQAQENFISLEQVLGRDTTELSTATEGTFTTKTLGNIPYTSVDFEEYKAMKKACTKMVPNGTGGMTQDIDDDKLMIMLIVEAVDKDKRSTFTFRNGELLKKIGKLTDEGAVKFLLKPGEIVNFAIAIQNASGFGKKAQEAASEAVKNS
jgi:hypothetical protein